MKHNRQEILGNKLFFTELEVSLGEKPFMFTLVLIMARMLINNLAENEWSQY